MPRIRLIEVAEAAGAVRAVFDDMQRVRGEGRVSNLFRGYAAFPELLAANWERMRVLMRGGKLSRKLKESIMIALAEINRCTY